MNLLYNVLMSVVDITALLVIKRITLRPSTQPASGRRPQSSVAQPEGGQKDAVMTETAPPGAERSATAIAEPSRGQANPLVFKFGEKIRAGLAASAVLLLVALTAGFLAEIMGPRHFGDVLLTAYGVFLHLPILMLGVAGLFWQRWRAGSLALAIAVAALVSIAVDAFLIEPEWLEVTHFEVRSSKLDQTVRVVVVADLQTDKLDEYERSVFEEVRRLEPDLLLFAGDYLQADWQHQHHLSARYNEFFEDHGLEASLGAYAVAGNVDWPDWKHMFAGLPVETIDETTTRSLAGLQLTCLGRWDSFRSALSVENPEPDRFHIVLGHSPDFALGNVEADLLLAGHTHGGQVRLPILGPLSTHAQIPRAWAAGATDLPSGAKLVVSRGIGMERANAPPLRFLCRPQLVVVDLLPESP